MITVWKYPLALEDEVDVVMPAGASLLDVQVQGDAPCLWALVSSDSPVVTRRLRVVGTGHDFAGDPGPHVGSFQLMGGALIFHVFDQGEV